MTAYTVTISEQISVFGGAPTNKWNAYNWNAFTWGEGNDVLGTYVEADAGDDTLTLSDDLDVRYVLDIEESLTCTDTVPTIYLYDADGYRYRFEGPVTDADERLIPTWTDRTYDTESWTTRSDASTTWSDA